MITYNPLIVTIIILFYYVFLFHYY